MPKVYFLDNGYRNAILHLFRPLSERVDSGAALENTVFSEMLKIGVESINFWRTQNKTEIDFVIDEQKAFEVKMNAGLFKADKYKSFTSRYPDIALKPIGYRDDVRMDVMDLAS